MQTVVIAGDVDPGRPVTAEALAGASREERVALAPGAAPAGARRPPPSRPSCGSGLLGTPGCGLRLSTCWSASTCRGSAPPRSSDLLGAPVSTGWRAAASPVRRPKGLVPFLDDLTDHVAEGDIVHVDEIGAQVAGGSGGSTWGLHRHARLPRRAPPPGRGRHKTSSGCCPASGARWSMTAGPPTGIMTGPTTPSAAHTTPAPRPGSGGRGRAQAGWADAMAALLTDAKRRADAAAAAGAQGSPRQRSGPRAQDNGIIAEALAINPDPVGRRRNALERASINMTVALRDLAAEVLRFTAELAVPVDNNQAEQDLRMVKLQQKTGTFCTGVGVHRSPPSAARSRPAASPVRTRSTCSSDASPVAHG